MVWDVRLTNRVIKGLRRLPKGVAETFQVLLKEIELQGPARMNWHHYGRLVRKDCHHCHLQKGRPTYVAVWKVVAKQKRIVEVTYVGTHEGANYDRLC